MGDKGIMGADQGFHMWSTLDSPPLLLIDYVMLFH